MNSSSTAVYKCSYSMLLIYILLPLSIIFILQHDFTHVCTHLQSFTSTGDALLVDFAQMSHAALV